MTKLINTYHSLYRFLFTISAFLLCRVPASLPENVKTKEQLLTSSNCSYILSY
ncbi:hypothetical protein I33_0623 [Bacillus subtilis subsp. subtilis str. RO-NN-1]|nr:hypothetical protein I33_0623 [Bacillus subtilis subsp. subtilis str. RO-NN-1]